MRPVEATAAKALHGGRIAYVIPLVLGQAYITAATAESDALGIYDECWTYASVPLAEAALDEWAGEPDTEPTGWHRHQPSNRRRENADPARETVRP